MISIKRMRELLQEALAAVRELRADCKSAQVPLTDAMEVIAFEHFLDELIAVEREVIL